MFEMGMTRIDEGVCLNQLIILYTKYRIGFHVVDFKYHHTRSHKDIGYEVNKNYKTLFYMIEGNHLYPIVDKQKQHSLSQIKAGNKYRPCIQVEPAVRSVHVFNNINDISEWLI
jgi:hypothetical protein